MLNSSPPTKHHSIEKCVYEPGDNVEFSFEDTSADITARNVHVTDDRPMSSADVVTLDRHQVVCSVVAATHEDRVCNNCNAGACRSPVTETPVNYCKYTLVVCFTFTLAVHSMFQHSSNQKQLNPRLKSYRPSRGTQHTRTQSRGI